MKNLIIISLCILSSFPLFSQLELLVETDTTEYFQNQPIEISIVVHNIGNDVIGINLPNSCPSYYYFDGDYNSDSGFDVIIPVIIEPNGLYNVYTFIHDEIIDLGIHTFIGGLYFYWYDYSGGLQNIESDPVYITVIEEMNISTDFVKNENFLSQNHPNPFRNSTTIFFQLNTEITENTEISIFNLKGQQIKKYSILNSQSSIVWDGTDEFNKPVTSGIYFYKLKTGNSALIKKMILMECSGVH